MTKTCLHIIALAAVCSTSAWAQAPLTPGPRSAPRPNPQTTVSTATSGATSITLAGCLYRSAQVPGTTGARAGSDEFVLADASTRPAAAAETGAAGTSGRVPPTGNMYEVERLPAERLRALVGKRVELSGKIDTDGAERPAVDPADDRLPEFEAVSIREIAGTCPATPAPRR